MYQIAYDVEQRLVLANAGQYYTAVNYWYDPSGKRVMEGTADGNGGTQYSIWFYGIDGRGMETLSCYVDAVGATSCGATGNVYFGGRMIGMNGNQMQSGYAGSPVETDRLGSVRYANGTGYISYYPYGVERNSPSTADGREKFGTYFRDSSTIHQDYADQRYYNPWNGSFNTPDPSGSDAADLSDPNSWNMYAYAGGDPVNFNDPEGLIKCSDATALNGQTFGSLMNAKNDTGLLARVDWAESDNGAYNGFGTQAFYDEKAAVAVSIMNRVDILNYKILISNGSGGYINPGTLGWGPTGASLTDVLNAGSGNSKQYASVSDGDITQSFRNSLDNVLNGEATSQSCIAAIDSWYAAYHAVNHNLADPFGSQGVTTSFHHGTTTGSLEPYFGTFNSPNNFFGIPDSRVVYNPSGTPPPPPTPRPIRRPRPPRRPVGGGVPQ